MNSFRSLLDLENEMIQDSCYIEWESYHSDSCNMERESYHSDSCYIERESYHSDSCYIERIFKSEHECDRLEYLDH